MGIELALAVLLVHFMICGWALIDVLLTPREVFEGAGQSKPLWAAVMLALFVPVAFGAVLAIVYLAWMRRRLREGRVRLGRPVDWPHARSGHGRDHQHGHAV